MSKKDMIDRLVADSVDTALNGGMVWLEDIFRDGFIGFNKMSKKV